MDDTANITFARESTGINGHVALAAHLGRRHSLDYRNIDKSIAFAMAVYPARFGWTRSRTIIVNPAAVARAMAPGWQ